MSSIPIRKILPFLIVLLFIFNVVLVANGGTILNHESPSVNKHVFLRNDQFFDRYINTLMKIGRIPSLSACIIKNNSIVWSRSYGFYDIENKKLASDNTMYALGSTAKIVTSTALMQLYDQGLFDLDDDVNDYLPFNLRNPNYPDVPITFRMLLCHHSSLRNFPFLEIGVLPINSPFASNSFKWLEERFVPDGRFYSPHLFWCDFPPGEQFAYSNTGYSFIGYLLEIISNQSFNEYCKEHIFEPLNMMNTSFDLQDLDIDKIAIPYILGGRYPGRYIPFQHYNIYFYPAAELRTSVNDMSHFLIAHMNGGVYNGVRILNESTVDLMHTRQSNAGKYKYGLGWQIVENKLTRETFLGHNGGIWGYFTTIKFRISDNVAIIYFMNRLYEEEIGFIVSHILIERALFNKADTI